MFEKLLNGRFWPLFFKEVNELRRNRRLIAMMLLPPTLNLVLLGFAMNPKSLINGSASSTRIVARRVAS